MSTTQPTQQRHEGTYIYCITDARGAPADGQTFPVQGIGGEPVRAVRYGDLAAIVSDSPYDTFDVTRENLTAHEQVVEGVMERSDVLPVSFGTVADTDQAVQQQLLATALDDLHRGLDQVRGRVELGLKVLWEQDRLLGDIAAEDAAIQALRDQIAGTTPEETYDLRTQLGELIGDAIERKRQQDAEAILGTLQPLAVDSRVNDIIADLMVLNASFLVDKQQIPAFEAQLDALRQAQAGRFIFQYSGPLPPYSFVSIAVGEGDQRVEVSH